MANPQTSVIIRTKNEGPIFKEVLQALKNQTDQDFEIVQVDDNSIDGTEELVLDYFPKSRITQVAVPKGKFTHPYSCNLGAEKAKGKYLVFINGHAIPASKNWLKGGLKNFSEPKVAGVYACVLASKNAPIWEKIFYNYSAFANGRKKAIKHDGMGILGTTNAIIRKNLWEEHHFNEEFSKGGEDGEWVRYVLGKGFIIIQDPIFRVYHSHNLSLAKFIEQYKMWQSFDKPPQ